MDGYLSLRDVGWLAVFITVVVAGIFLIRVLINLGGALGALNKLISKNASSIDRLLKALPAISENAVTITDAATDVVENLRNEQELIEGVIENVGDTIESVATTARAINEDFLGSIKKLAKTLMTLVGFISKKKAPDGAATGTKNAGGAAAGATIVTDAAYVSFEGDPDSVKDADQEKKARPVRKRSPTVRKKYADKGRNVNIHIR